MDFEKLLLAAKKNELNKKEPIKCLTTKFKPPSREQREKERVLSEGVQKFLKRKEEEERRKREEEERRKAELLSLRARDPKAHKRVQTMLKRTKSANKSVMEDAIDNNNTADTLAGPAQPDEDDYGFVSETSQALYDKLLQKMYSTPADENKFAPSKKPHSSNLMGTKERVKMALLKQEEEDKLPHKRSRKSKTKDAEDDGAELNYSAPDRDVSNNSSGSEKDKHEKPKPKKPMPPPVDFHELLRIAEKKMHEPVVVEPKVKKPEEPEVLMTKKQKLEHEKMLEWKKRRELRAQGLDVREPLKSKDDPKPLKKIPKIGQPNPEPKSNGVTSQRIPKISQNEQKSKPDIKVSDKIPTSSKNKEALDRQKPKSVPDRKPTESDEKYKNISEKSLKIQKEKEEALRKLRELEQAEKALKIQREKEEALRKLKELEEAEEEMLKEKERSKLPQKSVPPKKNDVIRKLKPLDKNKPPVKNGDIKNSNSLPDKSHKSSGLNFKNSVESIKTNSSRSEIKQGSVKPNNVNSQKLVSREFPPKDVVRSREFPPKDAIKSRQFPPQDVQRKRLPPSDVRRKPPPMKKRRIESDDEYDSEMDDFIDDGPDDDQIDISKEISQIFRYDKNKYSRYDDGEDDDECMESNFAQISKEEFISTKCGLLEDLRDIQREKAIKARKKR